MEKGYYRFCNGRGIAIRVLSQSTIKMEKGYYTAQDWSFNGTTIVAIHNKNGKGLLPKSVRST